MTTTISQGSTSTTPHLVLGYQTSVVKPTRVHYVIGRGDPDVTIAATTTRSGSLELFYVGEPEALDAVDLLKLIGPHTLTDDDIPRLGMTFYISDLSIR